MNAKKVLSDTNKFMCIFLANQPFLFTFTPNLNNEHYELQLIKR